MRKRDQKQEKIGKREKEDEEAEKILEDKIYLEKMIDSETVERISEETIRKSQIKLIGLKHQGPTQLFHRVSASLFCGIHVAKVDVKCYANLYISY